MTGEVLNIDVILDMGDTYFIPYYMKSICRVLTDNHCNFIVSDSKNSTGEICALLKNILQKGTSGVILQPSHKNEPVSPELAECLRMCRNAGIPYLMIDSAYDLPDTSYLMLDEYSGGYMAAEYLLDLGHTHSAAVYMKEYKDSVLRLRGFCAAFAQKGLEAPACLPYDANFEEALMQILQIQKPTALFCYNDEVAVACIRVLSSRGIRVPDELSVLGFDDSVLAAACQPQLTTIAHPKQVLGELSARTLLDMIYERQTWPYVKIFSPSLIVRDSCRKISI